VMLLRNSVVMEFAHQHSRIIYIYLDLKKYYNEHSAEGTERRILALS
jgi:hypothetical protein